MPVKPSQKSLLRIENLYKSFGGVQALIKAQIEIFPGEIHALLGENGAGKSTLVKIIAGALQKDEGQIYWEGKPIEINSLSESYELGIRIIYQNLNVIHHLTVEQNLTLGREDHNIGIIQRQLGRKNAGEILRMIGADLDLNKKAGDLRVAEQQLIEIGRALKGDLKLLVMDEPTSSLGEKEVTQLFKIMNNLRKRGVAIIFISHKLDETLEISDRITVLRDGSWIGTVATKATNHNDLVEMMVGRKLRQALSRTSRVSREVILKAENLWTSTGLKGISFELHKNELLGVYGLMGSGRTELARALFGVDPLLDGKIFINGQEMTIRSPVEAKQLGLGLVPEDKSQALFYMSSVRENLTNASSDLISHNLVINSSIERSLSKQIIDQLLIRTPSMEEPIARLSGGNQQKAIIGRWLMRDVPILILDDPTCGIDVGVKYELYKLLGEMTAKNTSVIMASSDLAELLAVSDRMLILHEGKAVGILSGKEMNQRNVLHLAIRGVKGEERKKSADVAFHLIKIEE
jgi:ribose transport system ATP-binding protein